MAFTAQQEADLAFTLLDGGEHQAVHYRLQVLRDQLTILAKKVDGLAQPAPVAVDAVTLATAFKLALQDPTTLAAFAKAVNDDLHARTEK